MKNFSESTLVGFPPKMPLRLKKLNTQFKQVKFLRQNQYKNHETWQNFSVALFRRSLSKFLPTSGKQINFYDSSA